MIPSYSDDTTLLSSSEKPTDVTYNLQNNLILLKDWFRKWRIAIKTMKTLQIMFALHIHVFNSNKWFKLIIRVQV